MAEDIFVNESLDPLENRINLALFGPMTQSWLREWFVQKLDIPVNSLVYPPTNEGGVHPDLRVVTPDGTTLAWIEVELGTNPAQVANYRAD